MRETSEAIYSPIPESKHEYYSNQVEQGNCEWLDESTMRINDASSPDPIIGYSIDGGIIGFEYEIPK